MITRVVRPESHNHLWAEEGEGGSVPDTQTKCTASYFVGPKKRDAGCSDAADLCLSWFSILALCPVHGAICLSLKPPPPASGTLVVTGSPHLPPPCGPAPKC